MKTCLILGAAGDTAAALAKRFAAEGYDLFLAGRRPGQFYRDMAADLEIRYKIRTYIFHFDGSEYDSHASFYAQLPQSPDVVISVFGYLGDNEKAQTDFEESRRIIDASFTGHVSILNLAAAAMEKRRSGCIIGISSVAGERGKKKNLVYSASKAGFTAYLSGLRNRLFASGVHVLTVKPGYIRTRMTAGMDLPAALTVSPEKVAAKTWKAFRRKKNTLYVSALWRPIMFVIRSVPEFVFKRMDL